MNVLKSASMPTPVVKSDLSTVFWTAIAHLDALKLASVGRESARFGLAIVVLWIGGMKFTGYEAEGIRPFVENSPLMSFVYQVMSVQQFSSVLGIVEIAVALLIASRFVSPALSTLGSLLATGMFATTLSFMLTTPGTFEPSLGGFPALSITGQFLLKDVVLLGVSIWSLGDGLARMAADKRVESSDSSFAI